MKKIMMGLIALVMCLSSFKAMAQEKLSPEQLQKYLKEGMVSFTENVSFAYSEGVSVDEFKKVLCNGQPIATKEGEAILNQAYENLSKKISAEEILKIDDGQEIGLALKYLYDHRTCDGDASDLFGTDLAENPKAREGGKPCKWYNIFCHLGNLFDWLFSHLGSITTLLNLGHHLGWW
jgi:hypothetical protein